MKRQVHQICSDGVDPFAGLGHLAEMMRRSPLDDPQTSAHAWARFGRLMKRMAALALVIVVGTLGGLYEHWGFVSVHFFVAVALGIGVTITLGSALMGLVFLSSGTGHDEAICDPAGGDHAPGAPGGGRSR